MNQIFQVHYPVHFLSCDGLIVMVIHEDTIEEAMYT